MLSITSLWLVYLLSTDLLPMKDSNALSLAFNMFLLRINNVKLSIVSFYPVFIIILFYTLKYSAFYSYIIYIYIYFVRVGCLKIDATHWYDNDLLLRQVQWRSF